MRKYICIAFFLCAITASVKAETGHDTDGDGLSDFQEIHKYFTDPNKTDTDGDGVPDSDWNERREYTYTIRTVIKVMRPCNISAVNDDYQDARVLSETKDYVELEVVHYPFNTNAEAIRGRLDWKNQPEDMKQYLEPGITTNWDEQLRKDIIESLHADNIYPEKLTDKEAVERVSSWLMRRAGYLDKVFTTYYVYYPAGHPTVYPGLENAFEREFNRDKANYNWTIDKHFDHELLGKGMFYNKTYGSCTSFAVYLTTVLRAIGIPTRMVLAVPIIDSSDPNQIELMKKNISNIKVRQTLLSALKDSNGFTAHTFNEVYVDGRWRRLNYNELGQNIYGKGAMGLMTHVNTFRDLSDANLAPTWGLRYGKGTRDSIFRHSNPYVTTEVSDHPRKNVTITKIYWFFSEERPKQIPENAVTKNNDGHLLIHADASFDELEIIYPKLDKAFVLEAPGHPSIKAIAERGYWNSECYLRIPRDEFSRVVEGVSYCLKPLNSNNEYRWVVKDKVFISKP